MGGAFRGLLAFGPGVDLESLVAVNVARDSPTTHVVALKARQPVTATTKYSVVLCIFAPHNDQMAHEKSKFTIYVLVPTRCYIENATIPSTVQGEVRKRCLW